MLPSLSQLLLTLGAIVGLGMFLGGMTKQKTDHLWIAAPSGLVVCAICIMFFFLPS